MKLYQFPTEKQCHVHITNGLIIYDLTKPLALNPTQTRGISAAWRLCVRSRCGGARGGVGRRRGISWDHRGAQRQKGHCGTN